ncbi:MAG: sarcosine oxidase subunit gamma, partial [Mesorhizobium sp.]
MAEFSWLSRSPLEHALVVGAHGARDAEPGISLTEIRNFDLIQVMARRGKGAELANAAKARFGMA